MTEEVSRMGALPYLLDAGLFAAAVVGDYVTVGRHWGRRKLGPDADASCEVISEGEECGNVPTEMVPIAGGVMVEAYEAHAPGLVIYR